MNLNRWKQGAAGGLLLAFLVVLSLTGCSADREVNRETDRADEAILDKEWAALPENEEILRVTMVANDTWAQELCRQFPDIRFEIEYYNGSNSSGYLKKHMLHPDAMPDVFVSSFYPEEELQKDCLLDLSVYEYADRYRSNFINDCTVDGSLYLLPGAFQMMCYTYNKTLFEEHGWKKPENNEELLALVKQIRREEPEMIPISLPGNLAGYCVQYFSYFNSCGYLSTPAGVQWERQFIDGSAQAADGFGAGATELQKLIDAGAFDTSMAEHSSGDALSLMTTRRAAMAYFVDGYGILEAAMKETGDVYGTFPFYGARKDERAVAVNTVRYVGLGKHLERPECAEQLAQARRVLDWMSTEEGQSAVTAYFPNTIPSLRSVSTEQVNPLYQEVYDNVEDGYTMQGMRVYSDYGDIVVPVGWAIQDALLGNCRMTDVLVLIDEAKAESVAAGGAVTVGEVKERMTNAEAAQFTANLYLETGLGEIALVFGAPDTYRGNYNARDGVNGVMFEGSISEDDIAITVPYNRKFETITLNGAQIRSLLEKGRCFTAKDTGDTFSCPYYWAGMEVAFSDGRVLSMKHNGVDMEDTTLYQVVMNRGGLDEELFQKEAAEAVVHEEFPNTTNYFKEWLTAREGDAIEKPEVLRR